MAKELAERLAEEEKAKKKAIRYPTEDLVVTLSDRDKKAGMKLSKPAPSRSSENIPFNETKGVFDAFLAVWNFLICFGYVTNIHADVGCIDDLHRADNLYTFHSSHLMSSSIA